MACPTTGGRTGGAAAAAAAGVITTCRINSSDQRNPVDWLVVGDILPESGASINSPVRRALAPIERRGDQRPEVRRRVWTSWQRASGSIHCGDVRRPSARCQSSPSGEEAAADG